MKQLCIIASLAAVFVLSAPAAAEQSPATPEAFSTGEGRAIVSPALQLPMLSAPPLACTPETRGTLALDNQAHLCLCDGAGWKVTNTRERCEWNESGK
jgi:hypothetical protein